MKSCAAIFVLMIAVSMAFGKVYSPKVLTEHVADLSGDWQSFLSNPRFTGKTGQALAEAAFQYITDTITGYYHCTEVRGEYSSSWNQWSEGFNFWLTRDPVLAFNVHGYGLCYHMNATWTGLLRAIGFDQVRTGGWGSGGGLHTFPEVYFNGGWHYLDAQFRGYVKKTDGTIPSWQQIKAQPALLDSNPYNVSPFFPFPNNGPRQEMMSRSDIKNVAQNEPYEYWPSAHYGCHTMDYTLRKGEKIRRYWQSDSGRLWMPAETYSGWSSGNELYALYNQQPFGPKPWVGGLSGSVNTTGFGVITYEPVLVSADYTDGVYKDSNVVQNQNGVFLAANGSGYIIFRTYTPYVIIACANSSLSSKSDDTGGAVIHYETQGQTTVSYSVDNGISWTSLATGSNLAENRDLSQQMYGRFGYLVKFSFSGNAGASGLTAFKTRTLVAVAPMSLPRLNTGSNTITFSTGDARGYNTEAINLPIDLYDMTATNRMAVSRTATYNPTSLNGKLKNGDIVFKALSPEGTSIKWYSVGAFITGGFGDPCTYTIGVSGTNGNFQTVATYVPNSGTHWNDAFYTTGNVSSYENELYVRYYAGSNVSSNSMNRLLLYAHYQNNTQSNSDSAIVTYCYDVNSVEEQFSFRAGDNTVYNKNLSGSIKNKWVEIACLSGGSAPIQKGEKAPSGGPDIDIFPNPFNSNAVILVQNVREQTNHKDTQIELSIFDIQGKIIRCLPHPARNSRSSSRMAYTWNVSMLPSGIYLVKVNINGDILTRKLVFAG
ncbi:MAG: hypothetical protein A2487_04275 [Candidatus Raymondbacteria bacterium RifOxyC12_full_50_8]|uniref:Secretion system C-terminal sorting domain-containing protein n=1 Tax=Candidatus Raymondbacteria bacterium RIFOXYD12_FULL_49_13 TaxID=1817890 RepID=A0A1F7F756_UNCRA|nr:MAG: hypothetical protein A2248_00215 [Candidatus Raymondbacteria bacterium RIFOXYA2_FULL_49_16]OGJ96168.1 MAG: hypothetical protein A2453_05565 [Candidatus Raymondbacteria bacterium RIFOXYC2_FULL_50_21]OGK02423.1 MAG: hypothetical protein A2519_14490 [Candidatus Raymondbacteria bacterium RIFOXYD12_FULL_49_13]OGK03542.1 MAG: hypothetical protein A2350_15940 [Candidatus Raymondbacteria bacterium RifOxyB12_full_50_8]OGK07573.1 MAG: hypothetical protein A2487_04275 [Candidatus Raymondbacteria b